jgi:metallo-beta-lactamase class B
MFSRKFIALYALLALLFLTLPAIADPPAAKARTPFAAFRIAGNLYYVGTLEDASYLVSTPNGLILINTGFEESTPLIRKSVEDLGFKWTDIKILLISHARSDHDGGAAEVVKETGATYEVMDGDVPAVESGGKTDYIYYDNPAEQYPPMHLDKVLHDEDKVELGGTVLIAHLTPGHTPGNTTWTLDVTEDGRVLHAVIVGSPMGTPGLNLIDNPRYPKVAADFEQNFVVLRSLPCDIFLGSRGSYFNLSDKYERLQAGEKNVWIDPDGYKKFIDTTQNSFEADWQKQKAAAADAQKPSQQ